MLQRAARDRQRRLTVPMGAKLFHGHTNQSDWIGVFRESFFNQFRHLPDVTQRCVRLKLGLQGRRMIRVSRTTPSSLRQRRTILGRARVSPSELEGFFG